jgi:uncharacterized membrane protein
VFLSHELKAKEQNMTPKWKCRIVNPLQFWKLLSVILLVCGLQLYGQQVESVAAAKVATFIEFDVPGSTCQAAFFRCTTPIAINPARTVTGFYADANQAFHGFVRASDGTITTFDPPGSLNTSIVAINPAGAITGSYCDTATCHGFVRAPNGTIIPFDPPGSVLTSLDSGGDTNTGGGINPAGAITGSYFDVNFAGHGFLRAPEGTFVSFDAPGGVNGTVPGAINPAGAITGIYFDVNGATHGFLRATNGLITTIDPPGSIFTTANSINPEGAITGWYQDASFAIHGFLRAGNGIFTTFDCPGSTQTYSLGINPAGEITGECSDHNGFHGFLRAEDGTITRFDPPGSNERASFTFGLGINPAGVITGWYTDPSFLGHGYLRIP